jgi:hypothetical protein
MGNYVKLVAGLTAFAVCVFGLAKRLAILTASLSVRLPVFLLSQ